MIPEDFSTRWFTIYYTVLGLFLIITGIYLIIQKDKATAFLLKASDTEKPPSLLIKILKYILLFTLPGLFFSFFPFSWIELLFTLWSLLLVYIAGIQLVRWEQNRVLIKARYETLPDIIRRSAAIMVAVGFALFLLAYLVIQSAS